MQRSRLSVGLFYASETGHTKECAFILEDILKKTLLSLTDSPKDIADVGIDDFLAYDFVIFGSPTWNIGELQVDLGEIFEDFDKQDWSKKLIAVYGLGDQEGYPNTYQDAVGILVKKLVSRGAILLGCTPAEGHVFVDSQAMEGKNFLGLALDEENQAHLTSSRIETWVKQLIIEVEEIENKDKLLDKSITII